MVLIDQALVLLELRVDAHASVSPLANQRKSKHRQTLALTTTQDNVTWKSAAQLLAKQQSRSASPTQSWVPVARAGRLAGSGGFPAPAAEPHSYQLTEPAESLLPVWHSCHSIDTLALRLSGSIVTWATPAISPVTALSAEAGTDTRVLRPLGCATGDELSPGMCP